MNLRRFAPIIVVCLSVGCGGESRPAPENFALQVAATVADGDFEPYWELNSRVVEQMAAGKTPLPTDGLASSVSPWGEHKVRDDFERVVRTGRITPANLSGLEAVVVATELQRFTLELFDASGKGIGVAMQLRNWQDGYRVISLYEVSPGKSRDSVVAAEY